MTAEEKERLYVEYRKKVLSYISSHVFNPSDVEDLCEEVFMKAFAAADSYDATKASPGTWLYSITKNTVIDYCRRFHPTEEIPEEISDGSLPEDTILDTETLENLAAALEKLPTDLTDIIVLHYYNNLPLSKIAGLLGKSYGMVKLLHNKALSALRSAM